VTEARDIANWRRALSTVSADASPCPDCPEPLTLWRAAGGELEPSSLMPVLDHVTTCPHCMQAWSLARELRVEGVLERVKRALASLWPSRTAPATRGPAAGSSGGARALAGDFAWRWAAAAGVGIIVTMAAVQLFSPHGTTVRGGEDAIVSELAEGESLPRDAFVLDWSGPAGARYELIVFSRPTFETIFSREGLTESEFRVPAAALAGISAGGSVYWRVEATVPGGTLSSPSFAVQVR